MPSALQQSAACTYRTSGVKVDQFVRNVKQLCNDKHMQTLRPAIIDIIIIIIRLVKMVTGKPVSNR